MQVAAPSLAFALQQQKLQEQMVPKIVSHSPTGQRTPHSQVATPARAVTFIHSPMHGAGVTPVPTPHHAGGGQAFAVSVIGPGGGTGFNGAVYAELGQDPQFAVDIVGRSRAPYDCYPEYWPNGGPAPNLHTFAEDVLRQGWAEKTDCFVFGSRGGQVVLPVVWQHLGDAMPPTVCINGGCAMKLPRAVRWPDAAITFLLLGGEDYFRGNDSLEEYIVQTKAQVPHGNGTTAILFVKEMQHMPQQALLRCVLPSMLRAIMSWARRTDKPPKEDLRELLQAVSRDGWSGQLMYTQGLGNWAPAVDFGPFHVAQHVSGHSPAAANHHDEESMCPQISRKQELKALFKAAALAAGPHGGAPLARACDRFHAAVQAAAKSQQVCPMQPPEPVSNVNAAAGPRKLSLPIGAVSSPERQRARSNAAVGYPYPCDDAAAARGRGNTVQGYAPCSPSGARTPNRLAPPSCGPLAPPSFNVRAAGAATPCSRALGMPQFHFSASTSPQAGTPCSHNSDSPLKHRAAIVVNY